MVLVFAFCFSSCFLFVCFQHVFFVSVGVHACVYLNTIGAYFKFMHYY